MLINFGNVKSIQCLAIAERSALALAFLGLTLLVLFSPYTAVIG